MDNYLGSSSKQIIGIPAFLVAVALLFGPPIWAQQQEPKLTASYAKAALVSLLAIELDTSTPRDKTSGTAEMHATQAQIDAADAEAMTSQEEAITRMLRQIYLLKLHDNNLLMAYRKLSEIEDAEGADENSLNAFDPAGTKRKKDYAASQLADNADNETTIEKREKACFGPLEESLRQRSPQVITACSEWIRKAKLSEGALVSGK